MNLGFETNKKIAEKYCLSPQGCPKLQGKTDYSERMTICSGCNNYLNKVDLVDLLNHFYNNNTTPAPAPTKPKAPSKGKSTELSKTQIKKILLMSADGNSKNKIATELKLHFTTVKNVIELGFKNEMANEKVIQVKNEMINDGLL
jgi:hypothetical protein